MQGMFCCLRSFAFSFLKVALVFIAQQLQKEKSSWPSQPSPAFIARRPPRLRLWCSFLSQKIHHPLHRGCPAPTYPLHHHFRLRAGAAVGLSFGQSSGE